jgi:hypothetical protein
MWDRKVTISARKKLSISGKLTICPEIFLHIPGKITICPEKFWYIRKKLASFIPPPTIFEKNINLEPSFTAPGPHQPLVIRCPF